MSPGGLMAVIILRARRSSRSRMTRRKRKKRRKAPSPISHRCDRPSFALESGGPNRWEHPNPSCGTPPNQVVLRLSAVGHRALSLSWSSHTFPAGLIARRRWCFSIEATTATCTAISAKNSGRPSSRRPEDPNPRAGTICSRKCRNPQPRKPLHRMACRLRQANLPDRPATVPDSLGDLPRAAGAAATETARPASTVGRGLAPCLRRCSVRRA